MRVDSKALCHFSETLLHILSGKESVKPECNLHEALMDLVLILLSKDVLVDQGGHILEELLVEGLISESELGHHFRNERLDFEQLAHFFDYPVLVLPGKSRA